MDVIKLASGLQNAANTTLTSLQIAMLCKATEELNIGVVQNVANLASISLASSNAGDLFYAEDVQEIFYNTGTKIFPLIGDGYDIPYAWGYGGYGRLGDNTTTDRSSPVTVVGNIIRWSQLSATSASTVGISKGIAYALGYNINGALGDNTTSHRSSPVTVVGGITNWKQVSSGGFHGVGVTQSGIAYSWGTGGSGRLGDGTTSNRSSPVTIVGGITNWSQVSAGYNWSLGLTSTGILYSWGANTFGQLGDNTTVSKSSPVTVVGGITTWSQLSTSGNHNLALTSSGIIYGWGNNAGALGDGSPTQRSSPVTVVGITNWSQVSAGSNFSLGVTTTGIAYAWGSNTYGKLGVGDTTARISPVIVVGGITNWRQLSGGQNHSLGVTNAGVLYAWGRNATGGVLLADGTTSSRSSPVTVVGGITNWSQVSAGGSHSVALRSVLTVT